MLYERLKPMIQKDILVLLSTCPDAAAAERLPAVRERLPTLHPYDLPEIVALSVADGHHPYLRWVADSTRTP